MQGECRVRAQGSGIRFSGGLSCLEKAYAWVDRLMLFAGRVDPGGGNQM